MRKSMFGCLTVLTLAVGAVLAPGMAAAHAPAAAYPTSAFDIEFGATWTKGTITWYNRSVGVTGKHRSVEAGSPANCRNTSVDTLRADLSPLGGAGSYPDTCGATKSYKFDVSADVRGGAAYVDVCLADGAFKNLKCKRIPRPA
ncbi:hypothetical protein [Streptomyces sp. TE33382]